MTFLMHAVNPEGGAAGSIVSGMQPPSEAGMLNEAQIQRRGPAPSPAHRAPFASGASLYGILEDGAAPSVVGKDTFSTHVASPWVPVVRSVLEFARKSLWMAEVRAANANHEAS